MFKVIEFGQVFKSFGRFLVMGTATTGQASA